MNSADPTPEQALASAYLDGDVTAAERAQVDASSQLLATVASLRSASKQIANVAAPSAGVREAGIAAALAVFDGVGSNVVSLDSRRRWPTRVLTAAAAVVLVGVVGVSVLRNNSVDSNTSSVAPDGKSSETVVAEDAAGSAQPEVAGDEVVLATSASILEINDPQELLTLTAPAPAPAPETADTSPVAALACMSDTQEFLADISYRGMMAIAVRDTVTGVTEAIDGNCTVLARVNP